MSEPASTLAFLAPAGHERPHARSGSATIALLLPSLAAGGVARSTLHLLDAFRARGHAVDLVLCRAEGALMASLPADVEPVVLARGSPLAARARVLAADPGGWRELARPVLLPCAGAPPLPYLAGLARYLATRQPDALLSAKTHTNLVALWARRMAGVATRVVVSERSALSEEIAGPKGRRWRWRHIAPVVRRTYPEADAIVAVSDGVADDLSTCTRLPRDLISTVYNPVVTPQLADLAAAACPHPWLEHRLIPVVVAAGRLVPQKNFPLLLHAFARLRAERRARLLILGEGQERAALQALVAKLGIGGDVVLPGFVDNPFAFFARASLFVLSSNYEGLPGALIQALACGAPVVATDCPSGPFEILEGGRYGELVPIGDAAALAAAMARTLDDPPRRERLRRRAGHFSLERSAARYLELLLGEPAATDDWADLGMTPSSMPPHRITDVHPGVRSQRS